MKILGRILVIAFLIVAASSYRKGEHHITFNTTGIKTVVSVTLATNLKTPFKVYIPVLFDNEGHQVTFIPSETAGQLLIEPTFSADFSRIYNHYMDGEYWYAFKKHFNPEAVDTIASFSYARITYDGKAHDFILPLFSLPLSILNFDSLYKCDKVLIAYQKTDLAIDVTVFSQEESWNLIPKAKWGFRHRDEENDFSRVHYPLGTEIQVKIGTNQSCFLNDDLPKNIYHLQEKDIYTLDDLLGYSTSLEIKDIAKEGQL